MKLNEFFAKNPRFALAFSGGVDSSYLLWAAKDAGCDVHAYFVKTQFQPGFELEDAMRFTHEIGVTFKVENMDILACGTVAGNPADRCYHCKKAIMTRIMEISRADGYSLLCDGTNADDDEGERPGMRALRECGVISPLRDCGLTKAEIRSLSKTAGLFTFDKPAYACLATRIPAGTVITAVLLGKIERAETAVFGLGFTDFRVRFLPPDGAVLQIKENAFSDAFCKRDELKTAIGREFSRVLLDLESR